MSTNQVPDELLNELDASMNMLGRLFSARHSERCSDSGLTMPQMLTLRILAEIGPTRIGELAVALGVKAPATSALVEHLERAGLLGRESDPDDRRVSLVHITEKGSAELHSAEAERRDHMRRYVSILAEEDIRTLVRINRTLIEAMVAERV